MAVANFITEDETALWLVDIFFFQAEDGIRDYKVTGVQTCALPICKVTAGSKLDLILDLTRRLMSITAVAARLRDVATVTTQLLDADRATIFIVDRDRAEIWSKVALGTGAGEIRQAIGVGIAGTVAATGETINIADAYEDPRFNPEPDHRTGYRTKTLLTFPMTGQNERVIGVFQVVNKNGGGEVTTDDEETPSPPGATAAGPGRKTPPHPATQR